jgi:hypothetical protein
MVVGNNDVDRCAVRAVDGRKRSGPGVGSHDEAHAFLLSRFDMLIAHSISIQNAVRYAPRHGATGKPDRGRQDSGRGDTVDVIVADDHDPLAIANCMDDATNRTVKVGQLGRIEDVVPAWIEKAGRHGCRGPTPCS